MKKKYIITETQATRILRLNEDDGNQGPPNWNGEGCTVMYPALDPDCQKCHSGSSGSYDPNKTGPQCQCCEKEPIEPTGTGVGKKKCCCKINKETGKCIPGTEVMVQGPADCPEGTTVFPCPGQGTPPTQGTINTKKKPTRSRGLPRSPRR